jgi:cytochrome P450
VAWVPALGGWLVTSYAAAVAVMRDSRVFTVDDPRFSTARVVGPSMLSLDGGPHARHRAPFFSAFHRGGAAARLGEFAEQEAGRLVAAIRPDGAAELRDTVTGPLAVSVVAEALGLGHLAPEQILSAYARIVGGVTGLSGDQSAANGEPRPDAMAAFAALAADLRAAIKRGPGGGRPGAGRTRSAPESRTVLADAAQSGDLTTGEAISNAAVVMFGGIDTTDGMIANAVLHLLSDPGQLELVRVDPRLVPAAIEESLRLEPAAALLDRYATRDAAIGGAEIKAGDRVSISLAAANRDPAVFRDPDRFDIFRSNAGRHLAFAHGPHFCIGATLARAETHAALDPLLALPRLRLDPARPAAPRGLIFRKPPALHVTWDP